MNSSEILILAERALGSSARLMEDYALQKRFGAACYWNPDLSVAQAARLRCVKSLVWC